MDRDQRADQLVVALGALSAMTTDAAASGEVALVARLAQASEEALASLRLIDDELADGWIEAHRCNVLDRADAANELRAMSASRFFNPPAKAFLARAAGMLAG